MLTDGELRLMRVLWERGESSVGQVIDALRERPKPAYNTVQTMLRILERKHYLRHRRMGRAFLFSPVVDRMNARRRALRYLITRFFDGSPDLLAVNLLETEQLSRDELRRLKERIEGIP